VLHLGGLRLWPLLVIRHVHAQVPPAACRPGPELRFTAVLLLRRVCGLRRM